MKPASLTGRMEHGLVAPHSPLVTLGAIGLTAIWLAVLVISLLAPDNVSGSQQEHVPIAAILTWIWGLIASRAFASILIQQRSHAGEPAGLRILTVTIVAVWLVAAVVGVFGPELVTGTDPTRTPIAAIVAPIFAMVLTTSACQLYTSATNGHGEGPKPS